MDAIKKAPFIGAFLGLFDICLSDNFGFVGIDDFGIVFVFFFA